MYFAADRAKIHGKASTEEEGEGEGEREREREREKEIGRGEFLRRGWPVEIASTPMINTITSKGIKGMFTD